jgi:hypothetical protein
MLDVERLKGMWILEFCYPLSAIRYPLSAIRYPLSAIRYPLSARGHSDVLCVDLWICGFV